jgi:hypothetical protein
VAKEPASSISSSLRSTTAHIPSLRNLLCLFFGIDPDTAIFDVIQERSSIGRPSDDKYRGHMTNNLRLGNLLPPCTLIVVVAYKGDRRGVD